MSEKIDTNENAGIALGLVLAAGASTGLGAAVVFFPSVVKLASRRVLAGSLGFSAGVMTYVSFIEIFQKANLSFQDAGHDESKAYIYSTLCFFAGVFVMMLLNAVVAVLLGGSNDGHGHAHAHGHPHDNDPVHSHEKGDGDKNTTNEDKKQKEIATCPCCSKDPVQQLEVFQSMAESIEQNENQLRSDSNPSPSEDMDDDFLDNLPLEDLRQQKEDTTYPDVTEDQTPEEAIPTEENKKLVKMGLNTAVAIGLHNFPEGLATFVAALHDPQVGTVLAFAIAIHNIPEGLCVALPIFYATGNRTKAFLWALLSGASEVVAALLGWVVLAQTVSDTTYAVLFGLVAGMMVIISIRELLPTAHFYDPEDTVITHSFIAGMALMALSLVMFQI